MPEKLIAIAFMFEFEPGSDKRKTKRYHIADKKWISSFEKFLQKEPNTYQYVNYYLSRTKTFMQRNYLYTKEQSAQIFRLK